MNKYIKTSLLITFMTGLFLFSLVENKPAAALNCWRANCGGMNTYPGGPFIDVNDCQTQGMNDFCAGSAWVTCNYGNFCSY